MYSNTEWKLITLLLKTHFKNDWNFELSLNYFIIIIWVRHLPHSFVCKRRRGAAKTRRWRGPSCRTSSGSSPSGPGSSGPPQRGRSWWLSLNTGLWHNFALRKQYKLTLFSFIYIHEWEVHVNSICTAVNLCKPYEMFLFSSCKNFPFFFYLTYHPKNLQICLLHCFFHR